MERKSVSIVIPTINEEMGIGNSIKAIDISGLLKIGYKPEILVIDGGSTDRTKEIAESLGAKVVYEPKKGYGRAYKTGFDIADGEMLISSDGDHTYPNEEIAEFVKIMERHNLDFLTTNRFAKMDKRAMSSVNKFGNWVLSFFSKLLFGVPFEDSQSGMWLIKKSSWEKIKGSIRSDGMAFSEEIKIAAFNSGLRCDETGISYKERAGEAKLNRIRDGIKNLIFLFEKRIKY